jgi:hypothetical protein
MGTTYHEIAHWSQPRKTSVYTLPNSEGLRVSFLLFHNYVYSMCKPDWDGSGREYRFSQVPTLNLQPPLTTQRKHISPIVLCPKISLISRCRWSHKPHPDILHHRSCENLHKSRSTHVSTFSNCSLPLFPKPTHSLSCLHAQSFLLA